MSDDVIFGDIETDDVFDAEPTIAPEQLARRLHKLSREVDILAGRDAPPRWEDLDDDERSRAIDIAEAAVDWIVENGLDYPANVARRIHESRVERFDHVERWDDLSSDERRIATDLLRLIVLWLRREGPR